MYPVAVPANVVGDRRVGRERAAHDEADVALLEHVARLVPHAGLGSGVRGAVEAERRHEEPGGGAGVADPELDAVPAGDVRGEVVACRGSSHPPMER